MRIRFALLGLLLLTACGRESSGPYPLVGAFKDYNETFKGVRVNFSTATSYLTLPSGTTTETELPHTDDFAAIARASENSVFMIAVKY